MPKIVVRPYEERDREAFFHVRAMTFNDGRPIPPEDQVFKTTTGYVGEVSGTVAGVFGILDFTCTRGDAVMRDAAVAGVAVLPEYRRSGLGAAMMSEALRMFRKEGFPMASLYAFRESYYRRFGYEVCGSRWKISVPHGCYPAPRDVLPVRRLDNDDFATLKPCYEEFCKRHSGMNIRTEAHWSRVIGKDTTIYAAGDPVEGYLLINHRWQFWEGQSASEFVWSSSRGYDSILGVLAAIGINKTSIDWYEPSDGPYLYRYTDYGVKSNFERPVMYRAVDVADCLRALKTDKEGAFCIGVPDDLILENAGPWRVEFSTKGVSVEKADRADFELPVRYFVQALLGEPSLADLLRNDQVCIRSRTGVDAAQLLLPPSPTYCTDFF